MIWMSNSAAFMNLLNEKAGFIILIFAALTVAMLVLTSILLVKNKRMMKKYEFFMQGSEAVNLEGVINRLIQHELDTDSRIDGLEEFVHTVLEAKSKKSFYKIGFKRYDAFEGAGGQLSFSLALLNDANNGVLLNQIHYRESTALYAKNVTGGSCEQRLTEEETEVLEQALQTEV